MTRETWYQLMTGAWWTFAAAAFAVLVLVGFTPERLLVALLLSALGSAYGKLADAEAHDRRARP